MPGAIGYNGKLLAAKATAAMPPIEECPNCKMAILTNKEKEFLDVFLHEATTSPFFKGPATKALYALGVEYKDISYIAWAYEQDVPHKSSEWGHAADLAPPLPWRSREVVLQRDKEIQRLWEEHRKRAPAAQTEQVAISRKLV